MKLPNATFVYLKSHSRGGLIKYSSCFLQDPGERSSSLLFKDTVEGTGKKVEGLES